MRVSSFASDLFSYFCLRKRKYAISETMSDETNEVPVEGHSDYKPTDTRDESIKHQLTGMYQNWFLDYASYVILERAVPHINDGLKPVQRRILHSMKRLDDGRYNKVANVVGHTMQFHPHGDASIGDALVQLGQKDLLIDCQGTGETSSPATARQPALHRSPLVQIRARRGVQSQNHRMEALLRRTKQRTRHAPGEVSASAGTGRGRNCRGTFVQNIAA